MSYPTSHQLDSWAVTLKQADWLTLVYRVSHAIDRDRRGGSAIPDGYPPSTLGGSGTSELTSTEAAALARLNAHDEHHDRTRTAIGYLEQTVLSLAALVTQLDRIEGQATHTAGREPGCAHHARHGHREERYRGDLCRSCYDFKALYRTLPPATLLDDRARGIRWTTASIAKALSMAVR